MNTRNIIKMVRTTHNVHFLINLMTDMRQAIIEGRSEAFAIEILRHYEQPWLDEI
jgi:tRNA-guanine family transglycosylase